MGPDAESGDTWWGVLRRAATLPLLQVALMVAWLLLIAIAAVMIGNRYGDFWGGVVGIVVGPLVLVRMLRSRVGTDQRKR